MKRLIFLAILLVGSAGWAFAQGGDPDASDWCVCVADNTCDDTGTCGTASSCSSTTFTVPDDAQYILIASTECGAGGDCHHCRACVLITYDQGSFPWCDTGGDCETVCALRCTYFLHPNITYTLTVCKLPCPESSCTDCGATCRAVACIKNRDQAKCPNP